MTRRLCYGLVTLIRPGRLLNNTIIMGKSETALASIGIKILLSDLILQINETNLNLIKKMLYDGCIEDSNGYYNESYINILGYPYGEDKLTGDYLECKEYKNLIIIKNSMDLYKQMQICLS